ncbi:MAG: S-methyl-5'-thioadenosine phosphorylase [Lentisphaerae bacterium]|nr:S-methyl-5'-thioadenosine phosphorylase [Lentisphaerota bacterium]
MKLGIIGGSGLYALEALEDIKEQELITPFGKPSDKYVCGRLSGTEVFFLPRHGRGHRLLPSEINHRANIFGFKMLEVDRVISVSAVGSLKEELRPRDIVLPDQYFDRTKQSLLHTFFGQGIVAHVSFAEPTCPQLRNIIAKAAQDVINRVGSEVRIHDHGTYVNMEGPAFSTKAESHVYRTLGFDVIGMTSLGEAKLCREAEICYQPIAMVTDYDCWHKTVEAVSVEMVVEHFNANITLAKEVLCEIAAKLPNDRTCKCGDALKNAILSQTDQISEETRNRFSRLLKKYI